MTTFFMTSNLNQNVGETNPPTDLGSLSEQELLYIEFVMALDAKLLPVSSSRRKTYTHFSEKKALKG